MRLRLTAMLACLAALLAAPLARATAPVAVTETPVGIAASLPDDEGNPVTLDGGVDVPAGGCPCPGVIINHGFLGNWHDSGDMARRLASYGYVVLRYSSRGFGKTPGEVDLMGPKEQQDLIDAVHWLNDPASPVVGGKVIKNDIGQFGGSYGGAHAWSLATSGDPAVRTVVPTATWTDIYQALVPNDVELLAYVNGFYATGLDPVADASGYWDPTSFAPPDGPPTSIRTTDNYAQEMHRWIAEANSGVDIADAKAGMDARSVKGRYGRIHIPVFIVQGTNDGLFNQNQAVDAYQALHAQGTPVRLYVGGIGHPPSDGSLDSPEALHVGAEVLAWFDHYLKGADNGIDSMPPIEYSHASYFHNKWDGATKSANSFPFGPAKTLMLCTSGPRGGALSDANCDGAPPAVAANAYAGQGLNQEPVTANYADDDPTGLTAADLSQAPPTLSYDGPALTAPLDMVGIPRVRLQVASVDALPAGVRAGAAAFQLDPKLYDVDAAGKAKLLTRGAFAEPLNAQDPTALQPAHEVAFAINGLSYTIPAGHHLRVTLNTSDAPYLRPEPNPFGVAVLAGSSIELPSATDMVATPALPGSP
jgi:ABC-2 type transport system ATP-binding protein